jgi:hypothetical protein
LRTTTGHFFEKELAGETGPSIATVQTLCNLADDVLARHPWDLFPEDALVLVEDGVSKETCFCSVLGALGEVRALHMYLGLESYHLFKDLHAGVAMPPEEFFAIQRSLYVEFVTRSELAAPDRNLLNAIGYPTKKRGTLVPIFRSIRPGFHPWYVTEAEGRTLADCQRAIITVYDLISANQDFHYWNKENVYPLVSWNHGEGKQVGHRIDMVETPARAPQEPRLLTLDEARIERVRKGKYPLEGVIEVDHFYGAGMIGEKDQRKACFRMGLAIDAESGMAYPPELGLPTTSTGEILAGVVLKAIESAHGLPRHIHVGRSDFKILLGPLAQALGFSVTVKKSLPALEFAKSHLLTMMGGGGSMH